MQWLKTRFPKEHAGMMADHDLGLEHSVNVTPCIIVNDNRSLSLKNELTSCQESSQSNSSVIQGVTPPEHDGELNYISKYLIQYVPTKKTVNTGKRATGARVLTSDKCARIIFEKEEKKEGNKKRKKQRRSKESLRKRKKKKLLRRKQRKQLKGKRKQQKRKRKQLKRRQKQLGKRTKQLSKGRKHLERKGKWQAQNHKWHIKDPDQMQKLSVPARDKRFL